MPEIDLKAKIINAIKTKAKAQSLPFDAKWLEQATKLAAYVEQRLTDPTIFGSISTQSSDDYHRVIDEVSDFAISNSSDFGVLPKNWERAILGSLVLIEVIDKVDEVVVDALEVTGDTASGQGVKIRYRGLGKAEVSDEDADYLSSWVPGHPGMVSAEEKEEQRAALDKEVAGPLSVKSIVRDIMGRQFYKALKDQAHTHKLPASKWRQMEEALVGARRVSDIYAAFLTLGLDLRYANVAKGGEIGHGFPEPVAGAQVRQSVDNVMENIRWQIALNLVAGKDAVVDKYLELIKQFGSKPQMAEKIEQELKKAPMSEEDMKKESSVKIGNVLATAGTPVRVSENGVPEFHLIVGFSEDEKTAYTVKLADINKHEYKAPYSYPIANLEVARRYSASVGQVLPSKTKGLVRVLKASVIGDECFADVKYEDGQTAVSIPLSQLGVEPMAYDNIQIKACPVCHGPITVDHDETCPHANVTDTHAEQVVLNHYAKQEAENTLAREELEYHKQISAMLDVVTRAADTLTLKHFAKVNDNCYIVPDMESELSIGSTVARFNDKHTGTIVRRITAGYIVDWGGIQEPVWPQEICAVELL